MPSLALLGVFVGFLKPFRSLRNPAKSRMQHNDVTRSFSWTNGLEARAAAGTDGSRGTMSGQAEFRAHRWLSKDGLSLYSRVYDAAGSAAAPVLCLHGLTRNNKDFEDLALHLSPRYRVICPDLRGRGLSASDPVWQNYRPGTYLADLAGLVEGLGLRRVAVIGTSLGGLLAMMLPAFLPGVIAGVVLNDIGPEIDPVGLARIRAYAGKLPPVRSWDEAVAQLQFVFGDAWPGLSDGTWARLARRGYREDAAGTPVLEYDPKVGETFRTAPAAAGGLWPQWAQLGALPVLAIRGALSDILSASTFARMQQEKQDLIPLTVAGRGHVPLLDEPECLAAIDAFLARIVY
jgi:pimeloyl-ACP methyl ester carboxylesterase